MEQLAIAVGAMLAFVCLLVLAARPAHQPKFPFRHVPPQDDTLDRFLPVTWRSEDAIYDTDCTCSQSALMKTKAGTRCCNRCGGMRNLHT